MKKIFFIYCCLLISHMMKAQDSSSLIKATTILSEAGAVFAKGNMALDITYTYADEQTPDIITDSLKGYVLVSGENYRGEIGNTLTVKNSRYSIIAFRDEKLLYVARSSDSSANPDAISPFRLIDNAIKSAGIKNCVIKEKNGSIQLSFVFPEKTSYKSMKIVLDKKSKKMLEISYIIKKSLLPSEEKTTKDLYAQVKTLFNYRNIGTIAKTDFDEHQFFTNKANVLVPATAYQGYEVFIGSPTN
ncbi:hypothetical protein DVR12_17575 [Chitinophaga silvatica]|uniref:DUF5117 domain-containing protein n=1 Tax=Chitinophaga silvatica TaxID=2282649 RepID=A0A3E1Y7W1_9BACT|nr:hypothetical protein [Chitinophaga silvatica]RFS21145.1 hypothetical protein DVR12_17575 [Chitinophaga silvatica]